VSLGRVQTPTLAIIARARRRSKRSCPSPTGWWTRPFEAEGKRIYEGRFHAGAKPRIATAEEAEAIVRACEGKPA